MTKPAFERSDAPPRLVAALLAGFLGLAVVSAALVYGFVAATRTPSERPSPVLSAAPMAGPRLEVDPRGDRLAVEAAARARLAGYGWTDRARGRAHIPIARAMALQAGRGWPDPDTSP